MDITRLLDLLSVEYDVHQWWPSESPFEVMVGAILVQQTNWETVAKVLLELRSKDLLQVDQMAACDLVVLESIVRPAGFYRQKAKRLIGMAVHIRDCHGSEPMNMLDGPTERIRDELLSLDGIGRETADSILVFAGGREKFVAAAYSARVLGRTGVFRSDDYDDIQAFVEERLNGAKTYRDLYALIVQLSKDVCLASPECGRCRIRSECEYLTAPGRR